MKLRTRLRRSASRLFTIGLASVLLGASQFGPPSVPESAASLARVRQLIGDARCASDAQCHSVGIGSKACGGPQAYLAWSSRDTDEAELMREVARGASAEQREAAHAGRMSTCSIVPDPGAVCTPAKENAPATAQAPRHCELGRTTREGGNSAR